MAEIAQETLDDLGWDKLLAHLARRTHTARGAEAAAALPTYDQPADAETRVTEITEARRLVALDAPLPFGGVFDVVTAVARAAKGGVLDPEDLMAVASTGRGLGRLRQHVDQHREEAPQLAEIAVDIADLPHVYQPILNSFDPDGRLADHASAALGPLRRKVVQLTNQLEQRVRSFVDDRRNAGYLQDQYFTMRDDRYVVPVRLEARGQVRGIIHGTSQSGRTLFVEPDAVVELQNRLKLAQCEVEDEERRILASLSRAIEDEATALHTGIAATTVLDVIAAAAKLAEDLNAAAPVIDREQHLSLLHARHPLMVLSERECVANDIALAPRSVLIISGPNAGGKTVALKTAGLLALMVRTGLHIPAETGSRVPWFLSIHTDIGDAQSLENDLSTFSAHLLNLKTYLAEADSNTLLLIDEVAVGTEPEQGAALAQAVLETLAAHGVAAIVTTHYERLKALGAQDPRFANASVGFDLERMEPTFRLHLGVPGSSGALAVARRMGLPAAVVDEAEALLGERRASVEELLTAVADERRRLQEERTQLAATQAGADAARRDAEAALEAAKVRERKLINGAHSDAVAALRQARDELERMRGDIKRQAKAARQMDVAQVKKRLAEVSAAVAEHAPARPLPQGVRASAKVVPEQLKPGTAVYVPGLGSRGQVVEAPQRGRVIVQIGTLRSTVAVAEVLLDTPKAANTSPTDRAAPRTKSRRGRRQAAAANPAGEVEEARSDDTVVRTSDITVDVRGERADEAVSSVDRFIDKCLMSAREVVFVIHGHGTGALRSAVRGHLEGHHAVARWRPGERAEGGDGVTIAWLDGA